MKKFLVLVVLLISGYIAKGQQGALTLLTFEGFTFADKFETYYGYGKVEDGFQWGAGLEFGTSDYTAIELYYNNLKADAYYDESFNTRQTGQATFNYIMLGGTRYAPANDKVSGFGSFDLGMCIIHPSDELYSNDVTKFAFGGRLGVRIAPNERISLRIHTQLMSPVQWIGGGVYFGTGGGGAGVSGGGTIYQFNLGGSLNIRMR